MVSLAEWQTLFSVQAECAATLTGLVFVAVSINLAKIIAVPGLPGRALESLAQILQVFFISTAALIPQQAAGWFGGEALALTLLSCVLQVASQIRYARLRAGHPKVWLIERVVAMMVGTVPLAIASVLLFTGSPVGLYWLMPGFVFSFLAGVLNAWILLIEINR
jgi:modulator of FtsH protease